MTNSPESMPSSRRPSVVSVRSVFKRSIQVSTRYFVPLFVIGVVTSLPTLLSGSVDPTHPIFGQLWLGIVVASLTSALCEAMVIVGTIRALAGGDARFAESAMRGLSRTLPVLVAWVLVSLIFALGIVLLIVPGLIAFAALAVVLPVCVVEDVRPLEALARSYELTTGSRWQIFWMYLVTVIGAIIVGTIVDLPLQRPAFAPISHAIDFLFAAMISSYSGVLTAVIYHDLRVAKEGGAAFD